MYSCRDSFFFFFFFSLYLFTAVSDLSCSMQAPEHVGSVVVAHGLSCPTACGILVPWAGGQTGILCTRRILNHLDHQESPPFQFLRGTDVFPGVLSLFRILHPCVQSLSHVQLFVTEWTVAHVGEPNTQKGNY